MKTAELFKKKTVFSLEVFPPKPDADESVIYDTLHSLSDISPDFISVTYGAGGGKNGCKTIQIATDIQQRFGVPSVAHLPCIDLEKQQAVQIQKEGRKIIIYGDIHIQAQQMNNATDFLEALRVIADSEGDGDAD